MSVIDHEFHHNFVKVAVDPLLLWQCYEENIHDQQLNRCMEKLCQFFKTLGCFTQLSVTLKCLQNSLEVYN